MRGNYIKQAVALMILLMATSAFAATTYTERVDGLTWRYTVENGYAYVGGGSSSLPAVSSSTVGAIIVPSRLGRYTVVGIGSYAFYGCRAITKVTFSDSITSIGNFAFSTCTNLTSVTIPNRVTSIGASAFSHCSGLTSVTIPDSVTSIGDSAFSYCIGLTSVTIPNSVTSIGDSAFYYCIGLSSVAIPNGVTSIGSSAFSSCGGLTSVTIPDSVTRIGSSAFSYCIGLTSVTIPNSVTSIEDSAFRGCSELVSVTMPNSVTNVGSYAFGNCSGLTSVTIPDSVTSIGDSAFRGCSELVSVTMPNSVTNVGSYAFGNCSGLTSVTIPDSVTSIGESAFASCSGLMDITVGSENPKYASVNGLLLSKDGKKLVQGVNGDVTIPASVTSIGNYAFSGCSGLTSVTIPDSVTRIGSYAFSHCSGLTSVTIPGSVTSIGDSAFSGCSGLTSVTIPNSVTWIGSSVFSGCSGLTSMTIPDSVRWIGSSAFSSCSGLTSVTIPDSVTSIGDSAFSHCSGLTSVTIPNSVTSIGNSAFSGCSGLTSVTIPDSVTRIGSSAFSYCIGLTSVTIPDSVTSIGDSAFSHCSGLTSVTIPNSVTSIGNSAFSGCSGLTSVTIPDSVTSIGSYAFSGCSGFTSVTIPDSVTSVSESAFNFCSGLMAITVGSKNTRYASANGLLLSKDGKMLVQGVNGNVTIPASVTSIGDSAFRGCSELVSVTMPNSVTNVGSYAFGNCSGLTSVTIPDSVMSIGSYAFSHCSGLTSMTIPDSVTSIGSHAFSSCSGLTSVTIPQYVCSKSMSSYFDCESITNIIVSGRVTNIGNSVFSYCVGLNSITFMGDAPIMSGFNGVGENCYVYVRSDSAGWGVDIPGIWQGLPIDYMNLMITFDANGGDGGSSTIVKHGASMTAPEVSRMNYNLIGWYTKANGGDLFDFASDIARSNMTLYAHWELFSVDTPEVFASEGNPFRADSCEVSIECATEGAAIYYTDDGTTPRLNDDYLYTGPFTITDTTVIKAIAVVQELRSGYVTKTIEKHTLTFEEALGSVEGATFATGGDALWSPSVYDAAKRGDACAKSGAIGNRAETWLSTTVAGAGTMTFWCKTSCEHDEDNMFTWDRLMIYTNGVEIAEWRMDGETDWTERTLSFEGGVNTVKWVYYKDRTGADGEDCAWTDAMTWTPSEAADPIPAVAVDADTATVNAAVDGAGFVDAAVKVTIGGSATEYNAFKTWAAGVKGATGDALAGEAAVVANAHAAAAYLLGAERLFVNEPTVEIGELAIVGGESAGITKMTVAVTVKDGASAVAVDAAKVAAMFEATSDLGDWDGAAKLAPTVTTSGTDASGKMTFVVTPGDGTAAKAFLRIRK